MLEKIIVFLIRRKLGVKKYEEFRFVNQKTNDIYFFTTKRLKKKVIISDMGNDHVHVIRSKVSLNWLMDRECSVVILQPEK